MHDSNQPKTGSETEAPKRANRLIHETSPYLLQHAYNPVDWHPWGPEAIDAARVENKPIFLSIGYSACHWCHVMERESFEDAASAQVMNEHYINIKVDREERPDLDQLYMTAVQLMTSQGGWPMSVWLTPNLEPFYGGTYFPPEGKYGRPGFRDIMLHLAKAWKDRQEDIGQATRNIVEQLREHAAVQETGITPTLELVERGARQMAVRFDHRHGGIGGAPKFPHSVECRLLMAVGAEANDPALFQPAIFTLEKMIAGGIHDQLGGGFHRYSTDELWLAPHFEKMLYDNALIPKALIEAYQLTARESFRRAAVDAFAYLRREMVHPDGPFFCTQDADSEGEEGQFFVWSRQEVVDILGTETAHVFCSVYDVTNEGNWEGKNILRLKQPIELYCGPLKISAEELNSLLAEARRSLFEVRERRIKPHRDEKILAGWNGLAIDTFASASLVLADPSLAQVGHGAANWIWDNMRTANGRLLRTPPSPGRPPLLACLDDYAGYANGLLSLAEATPDSHQTLDRAAQIIDGAVELFWDEREGGFFFTGKDHEQLIVRSMDPHDGATPSGNGQAVLALVRLALLMGRSDLAEKADRAFRLFQGVMQSQPMAATQLLLALRMHLGATVQVAVVSPPGDSQYAEVLRLLHERYQPNKVTALSQSNPAAETTQFQHPLLVDRPAVGGTTIYICRDMACDAPLVGLAAFADKWKDFSYSVSSD